MQKILKFILLSFIFVFATWVIFWGMQWFSNSVGGILIHHNNFLQSSLQTPFDNASASVMKNLPVDQNLLPLRNWQTEDINIDAQSAISVEVGSLQEKVLFKKNEQISLPIASLTKLMTALVVLNNYDLSSSVTIDQATMSQEGEQGSLKLGQVLSVENLLYISLIESSNRAAFALSEVIGPNKFITLMNLNTQRLGLMHTHFEDATGLGYGSYSTAQDLVTLTKYVFENYPLFQKITSLKEYDLYLADGSLHHKLINTNQFLGENNVVGGKTGFTKEAKGCFIVVQKSPKEGNYIISVVLGAEDRFLEMKNLINWIAAAYTWQ